MTIKKLKGKVVDKNGNIKIRNNQIIIYGVPILGNQNSKPSIIGVCMTDSEGNFSIPYPVGQFKSVTIVVSIKPDEIKDIILNENNEFPDFVWIVLETLPDKMTQNDHDDCACKGSVTPSLPDMEDLLENSAYSQDIGGACINFTTPNRALEEFNYFMVVRTSDPELLGLSREKIQDRINYINNRITSINNQISPFTAVTNDRIDFNVLPKKEGLAVKVGDDVKTPPKNDPKISEKEPKDIIIEGPKKPEIKTK